MQGSGTTRIDAIFANDIAKHLVVKFDYKWDIAIGYDHVPIMMQLVIDSFKQSVHVVEKPAEINLEKYNSKIHTEEARQAL
jgi:hypothetical protein